MAHLSIIIRTNNKKLIQNDINNKFKGDTDNVMTIFTGGVD